MWRGGRGREERAEVLEDFALVVGMRTELWARTLPVYITGDILACPGWAGPEMQALAPRGVAAVPDLRYGEGKKSPLSTLRADNTESATQT